MPNIIDYTVVSEHDLDKMIKGVQDLIAEHGWEPFGSLQVSVPVLNEVPAPLYCQAVVKYSKTLSR